MKKVFFVLVTMLIMTTLGACGSNTGNSSQIEEATTELDISNQEGQNEMDEDEGIAEEESYMYQMTEQEIQAALADYHGEYRCTADANSIVINDNGMYYDGAKLDIQSIGEGYVVLNNSNLIIILSAGTVSANFTHAEDNSYLDDYERIGGENVNHPDEQKADGTGGESTNIIQESEQVQLSDTNSTPKPDATNAYTFTCGGQAVSLPCSSEDLAAAGWTYDGYYFTNGVSKFEPKYNSGGWTEGNMINGAQGQVDWSDLAMADGITFGTTVAEFEGTIGKCDYVVDQGEQIIYHYKTCTLWVTPSSMTVKGISFSAK